MKKLILAASILFCTAATMTSCNNGDYDADPNTNNSGTTNPIPGSGGGGNGGGGGTSSDFNWTGTDPMSAKVDGVAFQADDALAVDLLGYLTASGFGTSNDPRSIALTLGSSPAAGTVINFGSTNNATLNPDNSQNVYTTSLGGNGAVKILENDATHVKGLFYFTAKKQTGESATVTEGYFNIKK